MGINETFVDNKCLKQQMFSNNCNWGYFLTKEIFKELHILIHTVIMQTVGHYSLVNSTSNLRTQFN